MGRSRFSRSARRALIDAIFHPGRTERNLDERKRRLEEDDRVDRIYNAPWAGKDGVFRLHPARMPQRDGDGAEIPAAAADSFRVLF